MTYKNIQKFQKNFFQTKRPTLSIIEPTKEEKPFEWDEEILKGKVKSIVFSANKNELNK